MRQADDLLQENQALRERTSALSAAILRINASLDVDTVLREVLDSALALTGAARGVIVPGDDAIVQDFVASGFTAADHRRLERWGFADGLDLFDHLNGLPDPIRLPNLADYVHSLGYAADLVLPAAFLGTPIRHRDVRVGSFFLAGREDGGEFTEEDEDLLVLFASQAAAAIVNARAHRAERRARADLEALVETSPIGVVVIDLRTGRPVSRNREARRIVEGMSTPGVTVDQLKDVLIVRRADGREVPLSEASLSLALRNLGTVRAEEVVLSVPGGGSTTVLVNATPIRSADGAAESLVVTMQDLAPLQELERSRAEFLGMVSHELRAPLTSIKGSAATVLGASPGLDPAEMLQFFRIIDEQADRMSGLIGDLLDAGRMETGTLSVCPEASEVTALVDQARNTFLSGGGAHRVLLDLPPDLPPVMADRRRIEQVLNNLLANAAAYSPGSSPIRVEALRDGLQVAISVADEGRGVPPERLPYLFSKFAGSGGREPGIGFGLGLSICKGLVEAHGGRIRAESGGVSQGTRVTFTLPAADGDDAGMPPDRPRPARQRRDAERILVVDDDPQALYYVRNALSAAGYAPVVTGDHRDVSRLIRTEKPRLVLLDLLLSGTDGIELMERVPELADQPVIFISGYGRDETIARALETGAADYMVKPFSPTELTARVRAALRARAEPEPFVTGDLTIHYERRQVSVAGRPVRLTATEYELLRVLSLNAGRVMTCATLLRQVWGRADTGDTELVRTFVKKLRRRLGDDAANPAYIQTERGVGYRMPG